MSAKAAYNVESAAEAYDVSRDTIARAIHSGALKAKALGYGKSGKATKFSISAAALQKWHAELPDA
jgi:predicted DNA-binding protein (UPF0251 family)